MYLKNPPDTLAAKKVISAACRQHTSLQIIGAEDLRCLQTSVFSQHPYRVNHALTPMRFILLAGLFILLSTHRVSSNIVMLISCGRLRVVCTFAIDDFLQQPQQSHRQKQISGA